MKSTILTLGLTWVMTAHLFAADAASATEKQDVLEILSKGGFMMYPLAVLSVIAVVLILFYMFTIRRSTVVSDKFMNAAEALIRKRDYLGLIAHCNRQNQSIARITEKTLDFMTKNTGVTFKEVREVAQAEGSRQAGMLTQRISYLADVGTIAPMGGLLGTVIGMIQAFMQISSGNYEGVRTNQLAEGVYQALVTTAAGLVIGIIAVIFYSIFRGRVQKYIAELEAAATHLMALLSAQYKRRGGAAPKPIYQDHEEYDNFDSQVKNWNKGDHGKRRRRPSNDRPDTYGI